MKRTHKAILIVGLALGLAICTAGAYLYTLLDMFSVDMDEVEHVISRGNVIVESLERYKVEEGTYPENLEDLVPGFLSEIQPPDWGADEWRYTPKVNEFYLSVGANDYHYPAVIYSHSTNDWWVDQ